VYELAGRVGSENTQAVVSGQEGKDYYREALASVGNSGDMVLVMVIYIPRLVLYLRPTCIDFQDIYSLPAID
jgi:hypothetical protein